MERVFSCETPKMTDIHDPSLFFALFTCILCPRLYLTSFKALETILISLTSRPSHKLFFFFFLFLFVKIFFIHLRKGERERMSRREGWRKRESRLPAVQRAQP